MRQIFVNKGKIITENVPNKILESGCVKVKTAFSCISIGTELANVSSSGKSVLERVRENPDYIIRGINLLKEKGLNGTKGAIDNSFDNWDALGYSASGIVEAVAEDVTGFEPGDRVACAGGNYATHSEIMVVPENLVVKIPDGVSLKDASSVAIGSIAMQGVRRADVKLGEYICVIGLGLIGQLTVQILKAAGAHVIAVDVNSERVAETRKIHPDYVINSSEEDVNNIVNNITEGMGADSVIITAATKSSAPLKQAFTLCRKRGRVVLVGVVDIDIDRSDMYEKELEFRISTSYGPGRYDPSYEQKGIDYPYHWVRFTENRNMKEYLSLIAVKKVILDQMYGEDADIKDADKVYEALLNKQPRPLMQVFQYEEDERKEVSSIKVATVLQAKDRLNVSVCGIGGFAKNYHLPNLSKIEECRIYGIMTRDGGNAKKTALDYGASIATTSYNEIIYDQNVDVILITTRHNLHYEYVMKALKAGKWVFVEKPLCMNKEQMENIKDILDGSDCGLMVGYNRRFSPHTAIVKKKIKNRVNPLVINYIMNAGYIPLDNWVHTEEGGGRIIGEACHVFDLFSYFTEEKPISVSVQSITPNTSHITSRDNVVISIKYDKGSVATLTYCSNGSNKFAKETCYIFCDNNTYFINDYKETTIYDGKVNKFTTKGTDKGHMREMQAFINACRRGEKYLIPLEEMMTTSYLSFLADSMVK